MALRSYFCFHGCRKVNEDDDEDAFADSLANEMMRSHERSFGLDGDGKPTTVKVHNKNDPL
jgi:hypothetical protein